MTSNLIQLVRISRRLREATGYLELGLPQRVLDCLNAFGPQDPFKAEVQLLRGEALRLLDRLPEAAEAFREAAWKFPSSEDRAAWLAMSYADQPNGTSRRAAPQFATARGSESDE